MEKQDYSLLFLDGDGIGPEVNAEVKKVIGWLNENTTYTFTTDDGLIGGAAIDGEDSPYPQSTAIKARKADAIFLGAVGGPKWSDVDFKKRPEQGLLDLRQDLNLFANLRPAFVFDCLQEASALKAAYASGVDVLIIRELTGGLYFGEPRSLTDKKGEREGINTLRYNETEIRRIAKFAFETSRKGNRRICSVDKANVLESMVLWRKVVEEVAEDYPDVELTHMYVDNAAMQLVMEPTQFDIILTENMFGDILSDLSASLTGSIGMLPSASLGSRDDSGFAKGLFEPVHGSAPDIAGKNMANPIAAILSFSMFLKHSLGDITTARLIVSAVQFVLASGVRTADVMEEGCVEVSTSDMGNQILQALDQILAMQKNAS
ncbi:MAG: 3-isopropylmalate dehydrogenase [Pseudomonadota bacterium]|nr:3-isopropylmalate dehydrogenase [Pseudomonadota bacterium]